MKTQDLPRNLSGHHREYVLLVITSFLLIGCRASGRNVGPSIEISRVPQADERGLDKQDIIEGRVTGARPGQQIVLYARSGKWWVQPLVNQPFTRVQSNTKWFNATHLGTEYAALLVDPDYRPAATMDLLPAIGGSVAGVAVVKGQSSSPSKMLNFSGYEWRVRNAPSNRGGMNLYDAENASVDENGAMHLRIAKAGDKWTCAEVSLNRSLGYGTYSFLVRDTSRLEPAATLAIFTWDYAGADQNYREVDIELGRWGDPTSLNAQYVVQPYYVHTNIVRFAVPAGELTHSFHWEPGRLSFKTMRGAGGASTARAVAEHVFTSGVPSPGMEAARMALYVFGSSKLPLQNGAEVVIERFEFLP